MLRVGFQSEIIVSTLFDGFLDGVLKKFLNVHDKL